MTTLEVFGYLWKPFDLVLNFLLMLMMYPVRFFLPSSGQRGTGPEKDNQLSVQIKCGSKDPVVVNLDRRWNIRECKEVIKPRLGMEMDDLRDIRIIFAGKELDDGLSLSLCDLGQLSLLYALASPRPPTSTSVFVPSLIGEERSGVQDSPGASTSRSSISSSPPRDPLPLSAARSLQSLGGGNTSTSSNNDSTVSGEEPFFYVYCSTCKTMQPGKIRVCCRKCKEQALVVRRDPCQWEDVLVPGRVRGDCPLCESDEDSEFFFKCASHPGTIEENRAIPLDLICSNKLQESPCLSCFEVSSPIAKFRPCGHTTCLECFLQYLELSVKGRSLLQDPVLGYTLPCPLKCKDSLIREPHTFRLLGTKSYEKYQAFAAEECVLSLGGLFCPSPECGMGLIPDECLRRQDNRRVTCSCGFVFCRDCLRPFDETGGEKFHETCCDPDKEDAPSTSSGGAKGKFPIVDRQKWEDMATKKAIAQSTKPCPRCKCPVERSGGCMHMVCPRGTCAFEWCWVCCVEWNRNCMGSHWFGS